MSLYTYQILLNINQNNNRGGVSMRLTGMKEGSTFSPCRKHAVRTFPGAEAEAPRISQHVCYTLCALGGASCVSAVQV